MLVSRTGIWIYSKTGLSGRDPQNGYYQLVVPMQYYEDGCGVSSLLVIIPLYYKKNIYCCMELMALLLLMSSFL